MLYEMIQYPFIQFQLLTICEKLQREKNLDQEIIVGIQKSMQNIRETYTSDLSRWKGERNVLEKHISQVMHECFLLIRFPNQEDVETMLVQ